MAIEKDVLDQLLACRDPKEVFRKGLVDELKKALSERVSERRDRGAIWMARGLKAKAKSQRLFAEVGLTGT
jgi:hypothetical protein